MNKIEQAISLFNQENYNQAENLALEIFKTNNESVDAIDILAAIYIKVKKLNFINKLNISDLDLVRKIASFFLELKIPEYAEIFYKYALELEPHDCVAYNNLGLIYEELDEIDKSKEAYEKSIKIKKNYSAVYNLGVLYRKIKDLKTSETLLLEAVKMEPYNQYANFSLGTTYFMQKDFYKGFPYFLKRPIKWDVKIKNFWDGKEYLDKTLFLFNDYAIGDAIMLARYIPALQKKFTRVKVFCPKTLHNILGNNFPDVEFTTDYKNSEYDCAVFAMNSPYYLNLDFNHIPYSEGYLSADEEKIKAYKDKYFNNDKLKIGIFFVGGELEKRNAKYRMIELERLKKLFTIQGAQFYSFQKDDVFDELKDFPELVDLGKTFNDYSDTAAAMKNLDLFITIDSSPAHMAGALGVKTFLMLPYYAEWRWFTDEKNTPWYNSVELFRQPVACDWKSVVDAIYSRIISILEER